MLWWPDSLARNHRHKAYRSNGSPFYSSHFILVEDDEVLFEGKPPHWCDQSSARLELIDERPWHFRRSGGENDPIELRGFRPAFLSIACAHGNVTVAERFEPYARCILPAPR